MMHVKLQNDWIQRKKYTDIQICQVSQFQSNYQRIRLESISKSLSSCSTENEGIWLPRVVYCHPSKQVDYSIKPDEYSLNFNPTSPFQGDKPLAIYAAFLSLSVINVLIMEASIHDVSIRITWSLSKTFGRIAIIMIRLRFVIFCSQRKPPFFVLIIKSGYFNDVL